jgi:hypothetical protein
MEKLKEKYGEKNPDVGFIALNERTDSAISHKQ